jgi:antitoxin MazE
MKTTIQKWGNSLAVRIPKILAADAKLAQDSPVELSLQDGRLVITPIERRVPSLEALVGRITDDNIHGEVDWGKPVGKEVW